VMCGIVRRVVALCRLPFVDAQTRRPALARDRLIGIVGCGSRRHEGTKVDAWHPSRRSVMIASVSLLAAAAVGGMRGPVEQVGRV
jgi:hypothetical protein